VCSAIRRSCSARIAKAGLTDKVLAIESRIDQDVTLRWLEGLVQEERATKFGPIEVDGIPIRYNAVMRNGRIEVGTYFVPREFAIPNLR
jgi:hypothetical protein